MSAVLIENFYGPGSGTGSTITVSVTVVGTANSMILVGVGVWGTDDLVDTISRDGQNATGVPGAVFNTGGSNRPQEISLYYILAPNSGTNNLSCTFTSPPSAASLGVWVLTNVAQTSTFGTGMAARYFNSNNLQATLSSAADELCFLVGLEDTTSAWTDDQGSTESWNHTVSTRRFGGTYEAGAASVTLGWTKATTSWLGVAAVPVKPVSSATFLDGSTSRGFARGISRGLMS